MTQTSNRLEPVSPSIRDHTNYVVCHVGNCDLPVETEDELDTLITQFELELNYIFTLCPKAEVMISSIPPRFGENREGINEQISKLNEKLKEVASEVDKAWFVNNHSVFHNDAGEVEIGLYKTFDEYGIHLNEDGLEALATKIMKEISFVYFTGKQSKWKGFVGTGKTD